MKASLHCLVIAGILALLVMSGCSKRGVVASDTGTEGVQTRAEAGSPRPGEVAKSGLREDGGANAGDNLQSGPPEGALNEPLRGFAKTPEEEVVKAPGMVIAKADQPENSAARHAGELGKRALADVYFAFDTWSLASEGQRNLAASAEFLRRNPSVQILVEGYCDERGSREYNLVLGEKRAKETRQFLRDLGIKNAMTVRSFGKERPACIEHDESCYSKNRRAHLVVLGEAQ